jgi:hypothetical protein
MAEDGAGWTIYLIPIDFEDWRKGYVRSIDESASEERFRELVEAGVASEYPAAKVSWDNTTRSTWALVMQDRNDPDAADMKCDPDELKNHADYVLDHAYHNPHEWVVEKQ